MAVFLVLGRHSTDGVKVEVDHQVRTHPKRCRAPHSKGAARHEENRLNIHSCRPAMKLPRSTEPDGWVVQGIPNWCRQTLGEQKGEATRCILFLKYGLPYPWPFLSRGQSALLTLGNLLTLGLAGRIYFSRLSATGDMTYWPFLSESQYAAAVGAPVYLSGAGANSSFNLVPLRGTG